MTVQPAPPWVANALYRIDALPCESIRDVDRKRLARRLVMLAEVDDPAFPSPGVWRDDKGAITLRWENRLDGPRVLEVRVTHPKAFQASLWRPGKASAVVVIRDELVPHFRRLLEEFWGVPMGSNREAMDRLEEVAR